MRWFRIRKAGMPLNRRRRFERFDPSLVGAVLAAGFTPGSEDLLRVYQDPDTRRHSLILRINQVSSVAGS